MFAPITKNPDTVFSGEQLQSSKPYEYYSSITLIALGIILVLGGLTVTGLYISNTSSPLFDTLNPIALIAIPLISGCVIISVGSYIFIKDKEKRITAATERPAEVDKTDGKMSLKTAGAAQVTKYVPSSSPAFQTASKSEGMHDIIDWTDLKAGEIGPITMVDGIYTAIAIAPTGEQMYLAMEPFDADKFKWQRYKTAAQLLAQGGEFARYETIGSLTRLGDHISRGGELKDCTANLQFPGFWTSDAERSGKLVSNLLKQKIVTGSSKAKELSTIPHASDGINLNEQTHMVYVSKSPITGRFKTTSYEQSKNLINNGFGAYVDSFGDIVMSVGVNIMEEHQLVENRGIFRNPLSIIEGGYGGISMMLHSFTCMVAREHYPSIEQFLVRPLKRMGEIFVGSIPKKLLPQMTINGIPGDQYNEGFEQEKTVMAPVKILADLHQARSKSL